MSTTPRLDILLYAHDGRGLGHASRTIAIGLALRRLYPALRVLFLSGCNLSQELIGPAPLDWLKLPSYETKVKDGKSQGITGKSNFADKELGILRGVQIRQIVQTYRPRVILADHTPQGKHRELVPTLEANLSFETTWVLGMRAVIGEVGQVHSSLASSLFSSYYASILWYGDSNVLSTEQLSALHQHYDVAPIECGYVSRLVELKQHSRKPLGEKYAGTISIPWFGEKTSDFLDCLYKALKKIGRKYGNWKLYLDSSDSHSDKYYTLFAELTFCSVEKPGQNYINSMLQSKCCLIYGGYNSLMDALSLSLPAAVILRNMQDNEQQQHLDKLLQTSNQPLISLAEEECDARTLAQSLQKLIENTGHQPAHLNLQGAKNAAIHLSKIVSSSYNNSRS